MGSLKMTLARQILLLLPSHLVIGASGGGLRVGRADLRVETSLGPVIGEDKWGWDSRFNQEISYTAYTGIPYAEPPLGPLRFLPPVPHKPWTDPTNVSLPENRCCVQITEEPDEDEDCLLLNIYVPARPTGFEAEDQEASLPVMVWLHGGAFLFGQGSGYGPVYWAVHDVLLVTINYRLGPLGFLTLGTDEAPGNQGLWDQHLALKWVQENIAKFGGDPNLVTLAGESAGSFSATYHLFNPASEGLFRRVIAQSGIGGFSPAYHQYSGELAARYGHTAAVFLGCGTNETDAEQEILTCLREKPASLLNMLDLPMEIMTQPVVDGDFSLSTDPFLPRDPRLLVDEGQYHTDVDILFGMNSEEGILLTQFLQAIPAIYPLLAADWGIFGPFLLFARHTSDITDLDRSLAEEVLEQYVGGRQGLVGANLANITNMISDAFFWFGVEDFGSKHAKQKGGASYQYLNTHKGYYHVILAPGLTNEDIDGNAHSDELYLQFEPFNTYHHGLPGDDLLVSRLLTTMWSNFMWSGNPTPVQCHNSSRVPCQIDFTWDERDSGHNQYMVLDTSLRMERGMEYEERIEFWKTIVDRLPN